MSITDSPKYKFIDDNLEQYTFPSELRRDQVYFIDRCAGEEWKLNLVQLEESLTREETLTLMREIQSLLAFMDKLNRPELHRNTEPGNPAFEEGI